MCVLTRATLFLILALGRIVEKIEYVVVKAWRNQDDETK